MNKSRLLRKQMEKQYGVTEILEKVILAESVILGNAMAAEREGFDQGKKTGLLKVNGVDLG